MKRANIQLRNSIACSPEESAQQHILELLVGIEASGQSGTPLTVDTGTLVDVDGPIGRFDPSICTQSRIIRELANPRAGQSDLLTLSSLPPPGSILKTDRSDTVSWESFTETLEVTVAMLLLAAPSVAR